MIIKFMFKVVILLATLSFVRLAEAQEIRFATDNNHIPFSFMQDGKLVGFDVELWQAIANDMGVKYKITPMDFSTIMSDVHIGQIDVAMAGLTITRTRSNVVDFSKPYYEGGLMLLVRDDSNIKSIEDLKGKTLAIKMGTSAFPYAIEHLPNTQRRLFPEIDGAYEDLAEGNVDAVLFDTPAVLHYAATTGKGKVKTVGADIEEQTYGAAFPQGSQLLERYNLSLKHLKDNGTYATIYKKWFGIDPH